MTVNLRVGNKIVTLPKFDPDTFIKGLEHYKPTMLNLVPPLISFIASHPAVKKSLLTQVTKVTGGAAPIGETLLKKLMDKVHPNDIGYREGFGMTELSPLCHMHPEKDAILGSIGCVVCNTMAKVVDIETGEALGPNEDGELCIS